MKWLVIAAGVVVFVVIGLLAKRLPRLQQGLVFSVPLLLYTRLVEQLSLHPISYALYRGDTRGLEVTIIDLIAIALYIGLPKARHPWPLRGPALMYIGAVVLSVVVAWKPEFALFGVWQVARAFFLGVVIARACENPRMPPILLYGFGWGLVVEFGYCLHERYVLGGHQISGSFPHQNSLGMAVNLVLPIMLVMLMSSGTKKPLAAAALVTGIGCSVLTLSRATLLLMPTVLLITYVGSLVRRPSWNKVKVAVGAIVVAAVVVIKSIDTIIARFLNAPVESAAGRDMFEAAAEEMVLDHPFGVGMNNFSQVLSAGGYGERAGLAELDLNGIVHNIYWLTTAELGILGIAAYMVLAAAPVVVAARGVLRTRKDVRGDILLACAAGFTITLVHGVLEWAVRQTVMSYLIWVLAALVVSLWRQIRDSEATQSARAFE